MLIINKINKYNIKITENYFFFNFVKFIQNI